MPSITPSTVLMRLSGMVRTACPTVRIEVFRGFTSVSSYRNMAHASVGSYTVLIQMIMNGSVGLYKVSVMAYFYVLSQGLHAQIPKSHKNSVMMAWVRNSHLPQMIMSMHYSITEISHHLKHTIFC